MSLYPLMLEGAAVRALVVGGGRVAVRKTHGLLAAGVSVRVVAPSVDDELANAGHARLLIVRREYQPGDIEDATLVFAATSSRAVNARVAQDARALGRLVNVADAPDEGTCTVPATHHAGDLVIAVSAGGVPAIAARVRDRIASHYGAPYAAAVAELRALRTRFLGNGDRPGWHKVVDRVIDDRFCDTVERGQLAARLEPWR